MANGVTTEWEDIHVKLGNYVERPHSPSMKELAGKQQEASEGVNVFEDKKIGQMDENEEEFEDDEFFKEYREKRLSELKEKAKRNIFGTVKEITKPDYIREVNEAQKGHFVFIHLYYDGSEECQMLN